MKNVAIALIERGEVLGLEECNTKTDPPKRQHTVICKQNGSQLLFLDHESFVQRVLQ